MSFRRKSREIVLQALYQFEIANSNMSDILSFDWLEKKQNERILIFASELLSGTFKNIEKIDETIKSNLKNWDYDKISPIDKSILRFSVFSLLFQQEIPPTIVINEGIDIGKKFGHNNSFKIINGVLDGIKKELFTH